jgi:hypothetical protein
VADRTLPIPFDSNAVRHPKTPCTRGDVRV